MASILSEHTQYLDSAGRPLTGGSVYIGDVDADPVANPKDIFSDRELTSALANPQTLDGDGRTTNKIFTDGKYSIQVDDINDVQVFQDLDCGETLFGATELSSVVGSDTITAVGTPTVTAYVDKAIYIYKQNGSNTGPATINIDGLGAKNIVTNDQIFLRGYELTNGTNHALMYNSTNDNFTMMFSSILGNLGGYKTWAAQALWTENTLAQNLSGGPIMVHITITATTTAGLVHIRTGEAASAVNHIAEVYMAGDYTSIPVSFVVNHGSYYLIEDVGGVLAPTGSIQRAIYS